MYKVRITVLKVAYYEELAARYLLDGENAGPCPFHEVGQSFVYEGGAEMPEGLCPWAWIDLYRPCSVMHAGGFDNNWYARGDISVECCTDGLRPVSFLLEAI